MKVSLSWLKEYVTIELSAAQLADMLTMAGLEVEAVEDRYAYLRDVVVGRIAAVEPHPQADRLKLCRVEAGNRIHQVVCGAPNAAAGTLAPLALPGSELPNGVKVGTSTIRGRLSEGMLCSAGELGLGADRSGLMILAPELTVGASLNQALGLSEPVLEISLTPNRPDGLSIVGIAREIAGFTGSPLRRPQITLPEGNGDIRDFTSIAIEAPDHCPRYAARLLDNLTVKASPFWLQDRLLSVGLRPISNLVDVTNFILMETGQPLHAFDFDRLEENRIVVRTAGEGERFTTLDGKERVLDSRMLMICDGRKPVGVAGVMGGLNSEIQDNTRRVLIESAYFNPLSIRRTAKKLGLGTDASYRFERGVDPQGQIYAMERAAQLMLETGGGRLIGGTIDIRHNLPAAPTLTLSVASANRLLGTSLSGGEMAALLNSIEFEASGTDRGDALSVKVPSFRVDVSRPEDLMEEIARRKGYGHIPVTFPARPPAVRPEPRLRVERRHIRRVLSDIGFSEVINYSFIRADSGDRLNLPPDDERRRTLAVLNPLSEDQAVMRTSLLPGLLETTQRNASRQARTLRLFETGRIFISRGADRQPRETEMLAGLWTGNRQEAGWHGKVEPCDFYDLKGAVETLLARLKVADASFTAMPDEACACTRPGATARILIGGDPVGLVGEVHPRVAEAFDLNQTAYVFEIDLARLVSHLPEIVVAQPLPRYPAVSRDITLIVDRKVEAGAIAAQARGVSEPLLEDVRIFDLFEGDPIPARRKSVSLRITYRSPETTLDDETVNQVHKRITDRLIPLFDAQLP